ncbi:MAG: hypothetical protein IT184_00830 [Acidobacteria bacterium]|nr:hypothetical protein [Acidobacteriota bacterium]
MTHRRSVRCWCAGAIALAGLTVAARPVTAQDEPRARAFVNVDVGAALTAKADDTRFVFPLYGEDASVGLARKIGRGGVWDLTGGVTLTQQFGVAVHYRRLSSSAAGALDASLPDPAFFDTAHSVTGAVESLVHEETWFAGLLAFRVLTRPGLDVTVLGGPAVVRVTHEVAADVTAPTIASVALTLEKRTRDLMGGQIGLDVRRMLGRRIGIGGFVRYSAAKGHLGAYRADLGGVQVGGGARLRF